MCGFDPYLTSCSAKKESQVRFGRRGGEWDFLKHEHIHNLFILSSSFILRSERGAQSACGFKIKSVISVLLPLVAAVCIQ